MTKISADHHTYKISSQGIENFYWPITHKNMTQFGERFYDEATKLLKNHPDQNAALIYKFCMKNFIAIAGGLFQSDLLKGKLEHDQRTLDIPTSWLVWPHTITRQIAPPFTPILKSWRREKVSTSLFNKLRNFRRILDILKKAKFGTGGMVIDGLKVAPLTPQLIANHIISTQRTPLICRQAKAVNEDVYYFRSETWFSPINDPDLVTALAQNNPPIEQDLIKIVHTLYAEQNVIPSSFVDAYLTKTLQEMAAILRLHYHRLLARDDLPKRLWTGTGGYIWDLLLRSAVIAKGGHVTAFDHGGGTAHVAIPLVGFVELWACHQFVTFNHRQALDIQAASARWPKLDDMNPGVTHVPEKSDPPSIFIKPEFLQGTGKIKKIFILSTLYDQDRGRSFAFYPDLAYVDWQARLMGKLKEWGYEVYFKPHPESRSLPPAGFSDVLGVHIIHDRFEEVLQQADLFIIDYTYTSIMIPAFLTNIPIVLIDFDNLPWHPDARRLIEERAPLIDCGFDTNNRVQIDWGQLKTAINTSLTKCNHHDYAQTYYV